MRPEERRTRIVDLVRERERVSVDALAEELDASRETIRRDLTDLAERGALRKFHGGAMMPDLPREGAFQTRMSESLREKRSVAHAAAALFQRGDTLLIDTGSTTILFAEELSRCPPMTIVTNSFAIAQIMGRPEVDHKVFILGGEFNSEVGESLGAITVEQISLYHTDHAVITVGGIDRGGMMDFSIEEARVARAMIAQARTLTVVADSSKFERTALFQVCALDEVDRLVVDKVPTGALSAALEAARVEVVLAEDGRTSHSSPKVA